MSSGRLQKKGPVRIRGLRRGGAGGLGLFPVQNTNSKTRLRLPATGNSGIAPRMRAITTARASDAVRLQVCVELRARIAVQRWQTDDRRSRALRCCARVA